jgi:indolepyruvate ferredoxin oxidoreductase
VTVSQTPALTPATHPTAVEIARLPDVIRGYENVKLVSVERYHARLAVLQARLDDEFASTRREIA